MTNTKNLKQIQIELAISEAERFIEKANCAVRELEKNNYAQYGCKQVASAKRASMDLTRALVFVRKSQ